MLPARHQVSRAAGRPAEWLALHSDMRSPHACRSACKLRHAGLVLAPGCALPPPPPLPTHACRCPRVACSGLTEPRMRTCRYGKLNQDYVLTQTLVDAKQQRHHATPPLYAATVLVRRGPRLWQHLGAGQRCVAARLRRHAPAALGCTAGWLTSPWAHPLCPLSQLAGRASEAGLVLPQLLPAGRLPLRAVGVADWPVSSG